VSWAGGRRVRPLAELGHRVLLLEQSQVPRRRIGESFPPSILHALEALGLRPAVEAAGFLRPRGAILRWSGDHYRPYGIAGFHVDRGRFDGILLSAAVAAGVRVLRGARAGTPRRCTEGWEIPVGGDVVRARVLVQATGRRARRTAGPRTLALWGYWQGCSLPGVEARVEATKDAWYWGSPLPDGSFNAAVFVDMQPGAARRYRELLSASSLLSPCLEGSLEGSVMACDATPYEDDDPISEVHLRVGDASCAIDPLSSQGVQQALMSALQGAVALHTLIASPADGDAAIEFYRARQAGASAATARTCARLYREQRFSAAPFWFARAGPAEDQTRAPQRGSPLPPDRPLSLAAATRIVDMPILDGDRIRRVASVHHPALAQPAAFLGRVALAPLARQLDGRTAAQLGWSGPVLDWFWQNGLMDAR
jgi:flavin-dependent dehydrogenase